MRSKYSFGTLIILATTAIFQSCSNGTGKTTDSSDTTAAIETMHILVDRPLESVIHQEQLAFENLYTNPLLQLSYKEEQDIISLLLADSSRCAILSRKLTEAEISQLTVVNEVEPKQYPIAYDAIALIVNETYPADSISTDLLKLIASGKQKNHGQLVFENAASGSVTYMLQKLNITQIAGSNIFAQRSSDSLAAYLRNNNSSIGFIPFSYISEQGTPYTKEYLKGLKILGVSYRNKDGKMQTVKPSQESITTEEYPFSKPIVLVTGNMKEQSGTVFVNFLHKDRAQRIFLKSGLVPVKFPSREIKVDRTPINATTQK